MNELLLHHYSISQVPIKVYFSALWHSFWGVQRKINFPNEGMGTTIEEEGVVISTTLSSLLLCRLRLFRRIPVSYCCVLRYLTSNWNKRLENRIRLIPLKQILRRLM